MEPISFENVFASEHSKIKRTFDNEIESMKKEFETVFQSVDQSISVSKNNTVVDDTTYRNQTDSPVSTVIPPNESNFLHNTPTSKRTQYNDIIAEMGEKYGVPVALISKVIETESNFQEDVVSSAGAQGLMQLMPKTAESLGVTNPFDPRENIEGGVKYLRMMLERYDFNKTLALAAYNAGPGNVDKYGGVPPFAETQNYIKKILHQN